MWWIKKKKTKTFLLLKQWRNLIPGHLFSKITQEIFNEDRKYKDQPAPLLQVCRWPHLWAFTLSSSYVRCCFSSWLWSLDWLCLAHVFQQQETRCSTTLQLQPWGCHHLGTSVHTSALMRSHHRLKSPEAQLSTDMHSIIWPDTPQGKKWQRSSGGAVEKIFKMIAVVWRGRNRFFSPFFCLGLVASIQGASVTCPRL